MQLQLALAGLCITTDYHMQLISKIKFQFVLLPPCRSLHSCLIGTQIRALSSSVFPAIR